MTETLHEMPRPSGTVASTAPFAQFFIPAAASLQERRPRTLKHGDTFAVFDHNGDALGGAGSPEGLYHRDTRYLSHLFLTLDDVRPMLLSSTLRDDNATLTCDLTNPDLHDPAGRLVLGHDLIHIRRTRFLWKASCYERIAVRNFDDNLLCVRLTIAFAADFADLFEVRGAKRESHGTHQPPDIGADRAILSYTGLDKKRRTVGLAFDPAPTSLTGQQATYVVDIAPGATQSLFIHIGCDTNPPAQLPHRMFFVALRDARRALRRSSSRAASVSTSNEIFNEAVRRGISDLCMLCTEKPGGPYPYAGIPWFSTVFGRDGLITALETLWLDPSIARGVLDYLASNQATEIDPAADAEPGKILHEVRRGEMAELGELPFRRYYGSIDSTPLFLLLAAAYVERTGDLETARRLWPQIEAALSWIDDYGDRDGDGFVEYGRRTSEGLVNQGWKDSHDSIFHADGSPAKGPIALAEVQAYVYGAWRGIADIAARLGHIPRAADLRLKAGTLRRRFDEQFYCEALGSYVLALDGDKRPCKVQASNAGHALFTGIAYPERAATTVATLMAGSSFSGWGVRTVAANQVRFNPMSYHNGSVWPHDNALIAAGFARYGFRQQAARIFEGLFAASVYVDFRRLPELFCGFPRQPRNGPTFYPVACIPQAWAAAAPFLLVQSCLGLGFDPERTEIFFDHPVMPSFLDAITLRGLALNGNSLDVALTRSGSDVVADVLAQKGDLRVRMTN